MRKLLGLIIFTTTLIWTWVILNSTPPIGFETHAAIQHKLSRLILEAIAKKKPEAVNAKIIKIQTEAVDDHKIKAQFTYQFTEKGSNGSPVDLTLEGESLLSKKNKEQKDDDHSEDKDIWTVEHVEIKNSHLLYSEGITVTPQSKEDPEITNPSDTTHSENENSNKPHEQ